MKVGYEALNSANVRVSNKEDGGRAYDIAANASVRGDRLDGIDSGSVTKDGAQKASFTRYGVDNLNVNFYCPAEEQGDVLSEVNAFVGSVAALAADSPLAGV